MSGDMSYCSTFCNRKDCRRNLRFNKPYNKYYSVTTFDDIHEDPDHPLCNWIYFVPVKEGKE